MVACEAGKSCNVTTRFHFTLRMTPRVQPARLVGGMLNEIDGFSYSTNRRSDNWTGIWRRRMNYAAKCANARQLLSRTALWRLLNCRIETGVCTPNARRPDARYEGVIEASSAVWALHEHAALTLNFFKLRSTMQGLFYPPLMTAAFELREVEDPQEKRSHRITDAPECQLEYFRARPAVRVTLPRDRCSINIAPISRIARLAAGNIDLPGDARGGSINDNVMIKDLRHAFTSLPQVAEKRLRTTNPLLSDGRQTVPVPALVDVAITSGKMGAFRQFRRYASTFAGSFNNP